MQLQTFKFLETVVVKPRRAILPLHLKISGLLTKKLCKISEASQIREPIKGSIFQLSN